MADAYDKYFGGAMEGAMTPGRVEPGGDAYDAYFAGGVETDAAINLYGANRGDPERAVKQQRLAAETSLPLETVERNYDDIEERAKLARQRQAMAADPKLATWASDPRNAAVGSDDFPLLAKVGRVLKNTASSVAASLPAFNEGVYGLVQQLGDVLPDVAGDPIARFGRRERLRSQEIKKRFTPVTDNPNEAAFYSGWTSAGQNLGAVAAGIATANPMTTVALMAAPVAGTEYGRARDAGKSEFIASAYGMSQGSLEYVFEKIPAIKLLGDVASGTGFGRMLAGQLVREMPAEQATTIAQDLNEWAVLNPDKPFADYLAERPQAALETAIATVVGVGVVTSATRGFTKLAQAVDDRSRARQAEIDAEFLDALAKGREESATAKRDPSAFAKFIGLHTEEGPIDKLYIPAQAIAEFYQSERIDWNSDDPFFSFQPDFADQMAQGIATGGDVVVNTADFAAHLAGSKAWDALSEDIRARADGMSLREARTFSEAYADLVEQRGQEALAEGEAERAAQEPARQVYDRVLTMAREAGVAPDAAANYAALYSARYGARAARLGTDALSEFERSNVTIRAEMPETVAAYAKADNLDILINAMRRGKEGPAKRGEPSLLDFIAKRGGVTDPGGDLASMGAAAWHKGKPGKKRLLKAGAEGAVLPGMGDGGGGIGFSPDDVAMAAWEAGYFPDLPDRPDVATLLEAMGRELVGAPIYPAASTTRDADAAVQGAVADLEAVIAAAGLDPATTTPDEIKAAVAEYEGRSFDQSARGKITFAEGRTIIHLFEGRDLSTLLHESGHLFLDEMTADAALPDAPQQLRDDMATVLQWFGVTDPADITIEHHEQWARGMERYLMEGKAPSPGLRGAFDAFRTWLLRIYQVVQNLRTPVNDEIRGVMDRLLATDAEIAAAREAQDMRALFKDAATAGMTDVEFAAYLKSVADGRSEAHDALLYRTMETIRRRRTAEWKDEESRVRADVASRLDRRPEFKALHLLRTGRLPGAAPDTPATRVKLDRQTLVDLYGADAVAMLPKGVPPLVGEGGIDPDTLAEMVGAQSGDALIRTLMGLETRQRAQREAGDKRSVRQALIEEEAAGQMVERYGDLLNDGTIEEEARAAVYGERQGEVIASEARALSRRARDATPTPLSIARSWARRVVSGSTVRETASPAALNRYARTAAKAGRDAEAAILAGDVDEAFKQKQAQLLNHALFMEAKAAAEDVDAAVQRLAKLAKRATSPSIDQDYLDQAHGLLEKFSFRAVSRKAADKREALAIWIATQQAAGVDVTEATDALDRMGGKSYQLMTVDELRGLNDAVMQIVHLGRLKKKLLDAKEQREFDAVVDEAVGAIDNLPPRRPSNSMAPTPWDKAAGWLRSVDVALIKVEAVFDWLDGGKQGVFRRVIWDRFRNAQDRERAMLTDYLARLEALLGGVPKTQVQGWLRKVETPELINRETGMPWQMTKDQVIAIALNTGNDGNMQRLLDGYGWSEAAVNAALDRILTAEDWSYVQGVWDTIETLWPEIAALEKRLNGVEPEKVEAREISNAHGTFRGGYYPAVYDPLKDATAAQYSDASGDSLFENSYTRATTPKGFTKARAVKVERPVYLSLGVIQRHIGEVIHDLAWREAVIDADRFLGDKRVAKAITTALGPEYAAMFRPWLQNIANEWARDKRSPSAVEGFLKGLRTRTTMVGLGLRLSTILQQPIGMSNVAEIIGEKWVAVGIGKWARNPAAAWRFVQERSPEMRGRFDSLDRDIRENVRRYAGQRSLLNDVRRFAFYGIGYADLGVTVPAWLGAWNKAQAEGMTEDEAASYADGVVTKSQGAGAAKDLSWVMRANEGTRLFTMFYSYFNALYARQRTLYRDASSALRERRTRDFPRLLARAMWLAVVPTLVSALVSGDEPEEDEDAGMWAVQKILFGNMASLPVVRDVTNYFDRGFGYKMSPATRAFEVAQKSVDDLLATVSDEDEPSEKWMKNAIEATGYALNLPIGQLATSVQFLSDVIDGDQDPQSLEDWFDGLRKGKLDED